MEAIYISGRGWEDMPGEDLFNVVIVTLQAETTGAIILSPLELQGWLVSMLTY